MSGKCTQAQRDALRQMEEQQGMSLDPQSNMGCTVDQPYGNAAAQEQLEQGDFGTPGGYFTPGPATIGGLEAVESWIKEGFDGEEDALGWQAARAIPGALGMGAVMIGGRGLDLIANTGGIIGNWLKD